MYQGLQNVSKMELSKRSLKRGSKVLVVDDFMKGGGTVNGMKSMIEEFEAELVGITVLLSQNSMAVVQSMTILRYCTWKMWIHKQND